MGSNQSTSQQNDTSMPSIYCTYVDKCPSRNRSRICVPCLYKNRTGEQHPTKNKPYKCNNFCSNNTSLKNGHPNLTCNVCLNIMRCSCTETKVCKTCYDYMSDLCVSTHNK